MRPHLRIALVAPPLVPVPPPGYGGTERVIATLAAELVRRGHDVTVVASGDSKVSGRLVPSVPRALWPAGETGDPAPWFLLTAERALERAAEFDLLHSHIEWYSAALGRSAPVPVVTTFHGRLDLPWAPALLGGATGNPVAISAAQAASRPEARWAGIVHNGLSLGHMPFRADPSGDLAFVGRLAPDKGVVEAIEIAVRSGRRLRIAAKGGTSAIERDYFDGAFQPALIRAGSAVEWLGELSVADRDRLYADSLATLMPGAWPEPFGLVAIESLSTGTPVIARRSGALPEIIRDGVDGFLRDEIGDLAATVDRAASLDRAQIRASVLERFSAERMADGYEAVFASVLEEQRTSARIVRAVASARGRPAIRVSRSPSPGTEASTPTPASIEQKTSQPSSRDAATGSRRPG